MKSISRRLFIKKMGFHFTLPLLSNFYPISSLSQEASLRKNFIGIFFPNGSYFPTSDGVGSWHWNNNNGVLYDLTQGSNRVNQHVMILRKIRAGFPTLDPHWQNPAAFLSGNQIRLSLDRPRCGRTIDQIIADTRGTPFRSLEIGGPYFHIHPLADHPNYPDIYMNRISWAQDELPLTPIVDPYQLFNYLFSGTGGNLKQIQYQHTKKKSILDFVSSELRSVAAKTSSEGRLMMEEYESGLREIEAGLGQNYNCEKPSAPNKIYTNRELNYVDRIQQFQKIIVFALKCQLTNVATMMYAPAVSGELYYHGDLGNNTYDHHAAAHNGGSAAKIARHLQVNRMHIGLLKHLLNLLKEHGLMNETLVLFGTDMSNGDTHNTNDIPTLLCGGGSDLRFGREITFSTQQTHTSILLSILSMFGIQRSALGEGTMRSTSNLNSFIKV